MSRWTGDNDSGSSAFKPRQVTALKAAMADCDGPAKALTVEQLSHRSKVDGRTVRAIFSALDGIDFLLGYSGDGVFTANELDEAVEAFTRRLQHQAMAMTDRVRRRQSFAARLPGSRQPVMF